jgi:Dolichyl-phosphate-mannose-protein mannosyltransferase
MVEPTPDLGTSPGPADSRRWVALGIALAAALVAGAWLDRSTGWVDRAFDAIAHLFYEVPVLARLRRPSQLALTRMHLAIGLGLAALGLIASPLLDRHGRRWWAVFVAAYAIRAAIWIAGSNLPLISGDSCHYVEIASSILRGEGPVKHFVDSFFIDYPQIRQGRGALDDWSTPLYPYVLAGAYRLTGVVPGPDLEATFAVPKGVNFALSLLTLPVLYFFARGRFGREIALGATAILAILPVHAVYGGFELRESLVTLVSILAIWTLMNVWSRPGRARWGWALLAGALGGLAILARPTSLALLGVAGLYGLVAHGRRAWAPLFGWGAVLVATIAPWGIATAREYGEPFYNYSKYYPYLFSCAVHHYAKGTPRPSEFYTWANAPEIVRVKIKGLAILATYSAMIFGLPTLLAYLRRLFRPGPGTDPAARDVDRLSAWIALGFVAGTVANIADVIQILQLGRYFLPAFVLMLPTAVAGVVDWSRSVALPARSRPWLAASFVALLWSDPTWASDFGWLVKPFQLHWPALRAAGDWVREHPEAVPPDARIMTWFPWEFRQVSGKTTVLLPRSLVLSKYELDRLDETIRQYGVTHVLWGSFEPPPNIDPELYGPEIDRLRTLAGFTDGLEIYRSSRSLPFPVRLYRLPGARR